MMKQKVIDDFHGEHFFLDNFYPATVHYRDMTFPTSEHAYQAMKSKSARIWAWFADRVSTPIQAKSLGNKINLRCDWEEVKKGYMKNIVTAKFEQHPGLAKKLLATGEAELIEGNTWGDTTWGVCDGEREELAGADTNGA